MLIDEIKKRVVAAMKAKNTQERDILKVVLGDLQIQETRKGEDLTDAESQQIVRKVIKGNGEMLAATDDPEVTERINQENAILESLLPKSLSVDEIVAALGPVADAVGAAGNDGQATGVAMKHLKSSGAEVQGKDVSAAVRQMRSCPPRKIERRANQARWRGGRSGRGRSVGPG
ncbi:MAG: GatB/YqeY domain-containing protein [Planctomycetota bacterium]